MSELDDVLEHVTNEGHLDELRKKVLEQLKHSSELQEYITSLLDNSKTLQDRRTENWPKKKVLDELRKERELESKVAEKAYQVATSVMCDEKGEVLPLIQARVHEALCALHESRLRQLQGGSTSQDPEPGTQSDHSHHHSHHHRSSHGGSHRS